MKYLLSVLFLLFSIQILSASYEKGLESLKNDRIDSAINNFEKAIKEGDNAEKSSLFLAILYEYHNSQAVKSYNYLKENTENYEYYITALWGSYFTKSTSNEDDSFFEFLIDEVESVEYNQLKNNLYETIAHSYKSRANYDDAYEEFENVNNIHKWQVAGEFENISGSGFDKNFAPISNPEPDAVFKNNYNADVQWFNGNSFRKGEWFYLEYLFHISNSIMYAQTFINSDSDTLVQGRLGVSGSVKVWTNDQLVFKEKEECNNGQDAYVFNLKLNKGWNRILLQLGNSDNSSSNFHFKLTDENGSSLNNIQIDSKYHPYTKLSGEKIDVVKNKHTKYIEDLAKNNPEELVYKLILFKEYSFASNYEKANEIRLQIKESLPNSLLSYLTDMEYYSLTRNTTLLRKTDEKIKTYSEVYPLALAKLWRKELENKNLKELEAIFAKMKEHPDVYDDNTLLSYEINIESIKNNHDIVIQKCFEGARKYPNELMYSDIVLKYYYSVTKEPNKAIDVMKDYLKNNDNFAFFKSLFLVYSQNNQKNKAFKIAEEYLENFPYSSGVVSMVANLYNQTREYDKAIEYYQRGLEMTPYLPSYHASLASIYQQKGDIEKSKAYYRNAIKYNPLDYRSRESLSKLEGEIDLFDEFDKPNLDSLFEVSEINEEHNLTVIKEEVQSVAYENGGFEQRRYLLIRANNPNGVDMIKEFKVPVYSNQTYDIEEAYLLKDGSKVRAEQDDNLLVFPNIEVGDAIKIVYKIWTYNYYTLTNHFWDDHQMNGFYPVLNNKYTLAVEGDKKFNFEIVNGDSVVESKSEIGRFKIYNWEINDAEILEYESYMPSISDISTNLYISSLPSWSFVSDWYKNLTFNKIKPHSYYKEILDKIIDEGDSDYMKAFKIYEYIVKEIRYSSVSFRQSGYIPQKSNILLDEKLGDCKDLSTLFVNLCTEAGLDANLVLANSRGNGLNSMPLPSINFNHCIAQLDLDDKSYYVETTNEFLPFTAIPFWLKDGLILPITDQTDKLMHYTHDDRLKDATVRKTVLTFEENNLKTEKVSIKYGDNASSMRDSYLYLSEKERRESMEKAIIDEDPSLQLLDLAFTYGLDNVADSVVYNYSYVQPQKFINAGAMKIFEINWTEKMYNTDIVASIKRVNDIELQKFFNNEVEMETITVNFPQNTFLAEAPENVNISNSAFNYSLEFEQKDNAIVCKRKFSLNKDLVKKEEYMDFKKSIEKIVELDRTTLVFKDKK